MNPRADDSIETLFARLTGGADQCQVMLATGPSGKFRCTVLSDDGPDYFDGDSAAEALSAAVAVYGGGENS